MSEYELPELRYLKSQLTKSSLIGGNATPIIAHICHLCGDETDTGEREEYLWVCFDCKKEREWARRQIKKAETP
jgi:hypothetical protein